MRVRPGRCACKAKVLRGSDETGHIVTVDILGADAAHELRAWAAERPTYLLAWKGHPDITPRTRDDVRVMPAGYQAGARVVLEHRCPAGGGETA